MKLSKIQIEGIREMLVIFNKGKLKKRWSSFEISMAIHFYFLNEYENKRLSE